MWYKKTAKAQDPESNFRNLSATLAVYVTLFTALHYRQAKGRIGNRVVAGLSVKPCECEPWCHYFTESPDPISQSV